jgi:hypothetical protein
VVWKAKLTFLVDFSVGKLGQVGVTNGVLDQDVFKECSGTFTLSTLDRTDLVEHNGLEEE